MSNTLFTNMQDSCIEENEIAKFLLENGYKLLGVIGRGYYGVVYKAVCLKQNRVVAIKGMEFKSIQDKQKFINEFECLKSLNHPNIVKVFEYISCYENNCAFYSMEYCQNNLAGLLEERKRDKIWLSSYEISTVVLEIIAGLRVIHSQKIIHFNISCENILIGLDGHFKIGDFGECRKLNKGESTSKIQGECSRKFGSPEQLHKLLEIEDKKEYSFSSDIYSLGVVFYYLTNKVLEYESIPIFKKVDYQSFLNPEYQEFNKLITQMIKFKPQERIQLKPLQRLLQSYLNQNKIEHLPLFNNQTDILVK